MGWASGSEIVCALVESIHKHVKDAKIRKRLYADLIAVFESHDWDTQDEAVGIDPMFDKLLGM